MAKVALVTGGSAGIGEAIALALARDGIRVAVAARTLSGVERVAAVIRANRGEALAVHMRCQTAGFDCHGHRESTTPVREHFDIDQQRWRVRVAKIRWP